MSVRVLTGDCRDVLRTLPDASVNCVVTSPPYFGLRDYGVAGQIGLEPSPDTFVAELVAVFRECRRVLKDDGTLWLNLGDSYAQSEIRHRNKEAESSTLKTSRGKWSAGVAQTGRKFTHDVKAKDLIGIPWRVAFALQADGWWLRQDIIWSKPNPMPESVTDRCTKAHEYLFLLSKSARYFYDADAIREPVDFEYLKARWGGSLERTEGNGLDTIERSIPTGKARALGVNPDGRNKRSVWEVGTAPFAEAHFATFPPALIEPCILAGCPKDGAVLDPFFGAGTTGLVADRLGRDCIGIELNPAYAEMATNRVRGDAPMFAEVTAA